MSQTRIICQTCGFTLVHCECEKHESMTPTPQQPEQPRDGMPHELETMSDMDKCRSVFRAVCEGKDCELSYGELEALAGNGYITNLRMVRKNRWSFEWTDALRDYAFHLTPEQRQKEIQSIIDNEQ